VALLLVAKPAEAAEVDLWYGNSGTAGSAIRSQCAAFNASQARHRIRCVPLGSYEAVLQRGAAAYRAGRHPVLLQAFDAATRDLMESGAVLPLDALPGPIDDPAGANSLPEAVREAYSQDGRLLAQPYNVSTLLLYGNVAALARAGVEALPLTWEEFARVLERLRRSGHSCPFAYRLDPAWWLEQASAIAGEPIATESNGHASLSPRLTFAAGVHARTMRMLLRWRDEGAAILVDGSSIGSPQQAFASGRCALVLESSGAAGGIARGAHGRFDVLVAPMPRFADRPRRPALPGGAALWVLRGHALEAYLAAAAFLSFVRSANQQAGFAKATGYLPLSPHASAVLAELLPDGVERAAIRAALAALDAGVEPVPTPRLGYLPRIREVWREEMQRVWSDRISLDDGLQKAVERGDLLLRRFEKVHRGAPR
jgi:sn-glycerol 3-phosphate transport system substrate-binding protein